MADYDYSDEEESGAEDDTPQVDLSPLQSALEGMPVQFADALSEALHPTPSAEQAQLAHDIWDKKDDYDERLEALLDARAQVTSGVKDEAGDVVVPGTLQRLQAARARLAAEQYDPDKRKMWSAVTAALGKPGSIGQAMGEVGGALHGEYDRADKFEDQQQKELGAYDTAIEGVQTGNIDQDLAALQYKIKARDAARLKALQYMRGSGSKNTDPNVVPTAARSSVLKEADEWFAHQRPGVLTNYQVMDAATERAGEVPTGPLYGLVAGLAKSDNEFVSGVGDFIKNTQYPEIRELERDVRAVIFPTVRQVLGAQFTAKENFALLETAFDPGAQGGVNKRRLSAIMLGMKRAFDAQDSYYAYAKEHNGDMRGYTGPTANAIGEQLLAYLKSGQDAHGDIQRKPDPNSKAPAATSTDPSKQYIWNPTGTAIIRNPNYKPPAPAAGTAPPRVIAPAENAAEEPTILGGLKKRLGFAEGGAVDGDTELVILDGKEIPVPKGMSDEEIRALMAEKTAVEKEKHREQVETATDVAAPVVGAVGGGSAAYALRRLSDAADERTPMITSMDWDFNPEPNPNYLAPGHRRFVDRFGNEDVPPEQRLQALIDRHNELKTQRGMPTAALAEAMSPEQLGFVNEAMRSPNSTGAGTTELQTKLGENRSALLHGDPLDVDENGRARSEGHTLDTLQADLQSSRPYTDVHDQLERYRKEGYTPLRDAAYSNQWVPVSQFDPRALADTDIGRAALAKAEEDWNNSRETHGRPMVRGQRPNPGQPHVIPAAYDVEFLDKVRSALNRMHTDAAQGQGGRASSDIKNINDWRRRYTEALYAVRPDLQEANAEYERLSRPIDAAAVGRGDKDANSVLWKGPEGSYNVGSAFDKMPTEELRDYLGSLDPQSREALISGLYENYRHRIQDPASSRNPLEAIFGSAERPSENMSRLKLLFADDPEALQTLLDDIGAHRNSYDIQREMGARTESARGRPRGAPTSKATNMGSRTVDAITSPARRLVQGPQGDKNRKFTAEEVDDIARIAAEHRAAELERLANAAGRRAGRKGRAGRAGLLGAGAGALYMMKDKLRGLADEALGYDEDEVPAE